MGKNIVHLAGTRAKLTLAFAGVLFTIALPRLLALNRYVTPDEHLWVTRSANFYYALGQRDFAATFQKQHPGVTVMWAGTAAFLMRYPEYRGSGMGQLDPDQFHYYLTKVRQGSPLSLLVAARTILVLAQTLILGLSFLYTMQLTGMLPALVAFLMIAFDPFHLGLTRLLHLDGLMSNLVLLSVLAWVSYLVYGHKSALIISGLAAGLGWLTKSPAIFLIPGIGLVWLAVRWESAIETLRRPTARRIWQAAAPLVVWVVTGIVIFLMLWPAMWVRPLETLSLVLGRAQSMAEAGHESAIFFNGRVYDSGQLGLGLFYFYPLAYLWRATPVVLLGLVLAGLGMRAKAFPFDRPATRSMVFGLTLTVLIFTLGFTLAAKKFDRYLLPVFAPLDLLAGLGWACAAAWLGSAIRQVSLRWLRFLVLPGVVVFQAVSALSVFPYYLNYYNPVLGGIQKADRVMQIGWGEGLDQAARYLNQKSNARDLHVSSWYTAGSFSYFFTGHMRPIGYQNEMPERAWEKFITSDYVVIYAHQWQRQVPKPILDYVSGLEIEHSIYLNGFEYARIYRLR